MSSSMSDALEYRQLRAPRQNGGTLVEPRFSDTPALVERNATLLEACKYDVQGYELAELREASRAEVLDAACDYTSSYLAGTGSISAHRVLVAGHQPELFHPGVWFKNFALEQLAQQLGGRAAGVTSLNLVVDNDLARATSIRAPARGSSGPYLTRIPLDRPGGDIPYEQRDVQDQQLFDSFPVRVAEVLEPFHISPLVAQLWPAAQEAAGRTRNLGLALAQARHQLEAAWGVGTLELPMSTLGDTLAFRWFASHLLAHLPRLHRHYNQALHDYRAIHGIRSRSHPVADLDEQQGWLEAPLWIWSDVEPWRRPVFARRVGGDMELTDRRNVLLRWPITEVGSAERAVHAWGEARRRGIRIRPRALVTTMFARLALGDLFLHGIGGAKYDQLTDEIMQRFFEIEPPDYMTLSATILLPIAREDVMPDDVRRAERWLRELRFHPEKHAPPTPSVVELAEEKRAWIARPIPSGQRKQRHRAIEGINLALQPEVEPIRRQVQRELRELKDKLRGTQVLASREYSFCLFPAEMLRTTLPDLVRD
jgi:hypothetical protein